MENKTNAIISTNCGETSSLIGQELVNFVIKASESLHNVLLKAKALPTQQTNKRRKSNFQSKYLKTKAYSKRASKVVQQTKAIKNEEVKQTNSIVSENNSVEDNCGTQSNDNDGNYEFQMFQSINNIKLNDELKDLPMEDFLSSPSWKQIVAQNSFLWPPNFNDM